LVEQVSARLRGLSTATLLPSARLKPWLKAAAASLSLLLLLGALRGETLRQGLQAFFSPPLPAALAPLAAQKAADEGPALSDITVVLQYPAYLKRDTETLENASGELKAPKGTQVTLSARGAFTPEAVVFLREGSAPQTAQLDASGRFSVAFTLDAPGSYRFQLTPASGSQVLSRSYPIELEEDGVPTIELSGVEPVVELSPSDVLTFAYEARDDHGLSRIDLRVEGGKGATRKTLVTLDPVLDQDAGRVSFYIAEWQIPEGGSAELWLEALDDDTVSGPKVGKSSKVKVVLSSENRRREQSLQGKEALKEALLAELGDALVLHSDPPNTRTAESFRQELMQLGEGMKKIRDGFAGLKQLMEQDAQEEVTVYRATLALEEGLVERWGRLEAALKDLTRADGVGRGSPSEAHAARAPFIEQLERGVLSMESFANLQRMDSILAKGDEIRKEGEELKDMINDMLKSGQKPDTKALLEKLQKIEEKLASMARDMSQLDRTSAEWYQNPSGDAQEVQDVLSEVRKLLEEGKSEDAAKKLEEYLKATDDLMKSLKDMQKEEFGTDQEETSRDMDAAIQGVKDLENQQKKVMADTQTARDSAMRKAGLTPERQEQATKDALSKIDSIRKQLSEGEEAMRKGNGKLSQAEERQLRDARTSLDNTEAALRARDPMQAFREANNTRNSLMDLEERVAGQASLGEEGSEKAQQSVSKGRQTGDQLARDLEGTIRRMQQAQQQAAQQGQGLGSRQESLRQRGAGLGEQLKNYSKDSPMVPGSWGERLEKATQSMQGATRKLQSGELGGGQGDQQLALDELQKVREEMEATQKAMQQRQRQGQGMAQSGQGQGQGAGQGKGKGGNQTGVERGSSENWGGQGVAKGAVDISKEYKAPEEYRREVMEGMQGEAPSRYQRLNREYYEKLVR
jgi:hypothetical protein